MHSTGCLYIHKHVPVTAVVVLGACIYKKNKSVKQSAKNCLSYQKMPGAASQGDKCITNPQRKSVREKKATTRNTNQAKGFDIN